jgi:antitoxin component of MazEF toxin-antitoxin module
MIQKLIKVGTSVAVVVPKKSLKELEIKAGDSVSVAVDADRRRIVVEPPAIVDRELVAWTRTFIKRYRPALEALKDK